jgi:hypothetical protein
VPVAAALWTADAFSVSRTGRVEIDVGDTFLSKNWAKGKFLDSSRQWNPPLALEKFKSRRQVGLHGVAPPGEASATRPVARLVGFGIGFGLLQRREFGD